MKGRSRGRCFVGEGGVMVKETISKKDYCLMVAILAQGFLQKCPDYFWTRGYPDGRGTLSMTFNEDRLYDASLIADKIIEYVGAEVAE